MPHNDGFDKLPVYIIPEPPYPQDSFEGRLTQFLADECQKQNIKSFLLLNEKDRLETCFGMMSYVPKRKVVTITLRGMDKIGQYEFYADCIEMAREVCGAFLCHELDFALEGFICCQRSPSTRNH